jgi:hypothetical protein
LSLRLFHVPTRSPLEPVPVFHSLCSCTLIYDLFFLFSFFLFCDWYICACVLNPG